MGPAAPARPHERDRTPLVATFAGLMLVALALRPQIIAIGPLVPYIRSDLGMTFAAAGLLASIPVLCMGLFAPLAGRLVQRLGSRNGVAACVAGIILFGLLRAASPDAVTALTVTFGIGIGLGVVGPVLPVIVRERAAAHPALFTGAYASGIVLGGAMGAALAVPLAEVAGWRGALAVLSLAALPSLAAWLVLVRAGARAAATADARAPLPWRSPSAWLLGLLFGLQSILYYGTQSWLANVYLERGETTADAAALVVLFNVLGFGATLVGPMLADRLGSRRAQLTLAAVASLIGCVGIAAGWMPPPVWVGFLALGTGATFPLVLTLPVDAAERPTEVGVIAALMLLIGYVISSAAPFALGLARDVTGDFGASVWLLVGVALALVALVALTSPTRRREAAGVGS